MSISQITPSSVKAPTPSAVSRTATAKPDADGDFAGSKTATDDAVKVTLSDAAKSLAAANKPETNA